MLRYLAIFGRGRAARSGTPPLSPARAGLCLVMEGRAIAVWSNHEVDAAPIDHRGIVLGTLFSRAERYPRVTRIGGDDPAGYEPDLTWLLRSHWGSYVAILETSTGVDILRDPGGGLPCFYLRHGGSVVFASDMATLAAAGLPRPPIAWPGVVQYLRTPSLPSTDTALTDVAELLPGFRLSTAGPVLSAQAVWSPWDHVERRIAARDEADRLRITVRNCVSAWAARYPDLVLRVSGGLDSSIVAAALAQTQARVHGLTMVGDGTGDERRYLHALTRKLGFEVEEARFAVGDVDVGRASAPHLPRPYGRLIGQALASPLHAVTGRTTSQACFDGIGGDAVFGFLASASPAADRLLREGPIAALSSAGDIARQTGASAGTIAYRAVRRAWFQTRSYAWRGDERLLAAEHRCEPVAGAAHPWLKAPRGAAPSSAARIATVMRAIVQAGNSGRPDTVPMVSPLLSQPIVELCLSIPSWRWCEGGRDRTVARQAFSGDLPREIIARRGKGGPEAFCYEVLDTHRQALRDRLLGGELARHGIIDRGALEPILASSAPLAANMFLRVLDLAEAEAWAEAWR